MTTSPFLLMHTLVRSTTYGQSSSSVRLLFLALFIMRNPLFSRSTMSTRYIWTIYLRDLVAVGESESLVLSLCSLIILTLRVAPPILDDFSSTYSLKCTKFSGVDRQLLIRSINSKESSSLRDTLSQSFTLYKSFASSGGSSWNIIIQIIYFYPAIS